MTVSVDIEVARRNGVLIAPADAVHDAATAHPWVLAVRDGRAVKQPVKVGMRGDAAIELTSGVSVGESLVPATNAVVAAGQRVRTAPIRNRGG
jgi:HlyD family secretion protein